MNATMRRALSCPRALLRRLDVPGPRYTSYPTADRFVEAFGPTEYAQALRQRAEGAMVGGVPPLSVYVHIPFCESLCYYCGCNKVITKHHERAGEYLDALEKEIALHVDRLGAGQTVSQLHFGGGSPTFLSDAELSRLMGTLRQAFRASHRKPRTRSRSIRAPPRPSGWRTWPQLGFNRLSFGVQDFDPPCSRPCTGAEPRQRATSLMHRRAHSASNRSTPT
ncbi:radical SAM protein [Piscinibacter sp.]|uniref:radical SAM protein n=1 Tax=Piscinibacter sp. TaxID=1903157 RepID=UPI003442DBDD